MEELGLSIKLNQLVQVAATILALVISYATLSITRRQYAGSPPIGLVRSWRRLDEPTVTERMHLVVNFWNHRKYALELCTFQIVVPNERWLRLKPEPDQKHGFDTRLKLIEGLVIPPGECRRLEFETPYHLDEEHFGPYPFAIVLGYLDPRAGRYRNMWLYSEFLRPGRVRRFKNRVANRLYYPTLTEGIKLRSLASRKPRR